MSSCAAIYNPIEPSYLSYELAGNYNGLKFSKQLGISKFVFKGERFNSTFLRGIATNKKGKMFFPKVDISKDNGATGAKELSKLDRRGKIRFNRVRAIDTLELIQEQDEVCLLHMDVQGAELNIIKGMGEFKDKINYIYTEYSDEELYENQGTKQQIIDLLGPNWIVVFDFGGDILLKNKNY
jgi:FkbM family methyltransferase